MKKTCFSACQSQRRQNGAAAVEFALGLLAFMVLLLGTLQAMTYSYQLGAAGIATERGARAAAMCVNRSTDSVTHLKNRAVGVMQNFLPGLSDADVDVALSPTGCSSTGTACEVVTVSLSNAQGAGYQVSAWAPFTTSMPLPASALRSSRSLEMPVSTTC